MTEALFLIDPQGNIAMLNPAAKAAMGYTNEDSIGRPITDILAPEYSHHPQNIWADPNGKPESLRDEEYRLLTHHSGEIPLSLSGSTVPDDQGTVLGAVLVGRDLTRRKKTEALARTSLAEKEVLLKEIHHRFKNNLQIASSLLLLQANATDDPQASRILREGKSRIQSMVEIHEILNQSTNAGQVNFRQYVKRLANNLERSH